MGASTRTPRPPLCGPPSRPTRLFRGPQVKNGKIVEKKVKDTAGTQAYRPPESNLNKYHSPLKIDVWALGIVSFSLVAGFFPLQVAKPPSPVATRRAP